MKAFCDMLEVRAAELWQAMSTAAFSDSDSTPIDQQPCAPEGPLEITHESTSVFWKADITRMSAVER